MFTTKDEMQVSRIFDSLEWRAEICEESHIKFTCENSQSTDSESVAVDMLLGDDTGPIFTTLWNDAAIAFIEQCDALNRAEDRGGLDGVIINLDFALVTAVPKNDWNGICITPVRNLQSVATIKLEQAQL